MDILVVIIIIAIWVSARRNRPHRTYHVRTVTRNRKGWGEW